jgi:hypothetical protein
MQINPTIDPGTVIKRTLSYARPLTRPAKTWPATDSTRNVTPTAIIRSPSGRLFDSQVNIGDSFPLSASPAPNRETRPCR